MNSPSARSQLNHTESRLIHGYIMPLAVAELDFVRHIVEERSGIVFSSAQGYLVESKLKSVLPSTGMQTVDELVAEMRRSKASALLERVTEAMTINETSFFRDIHPFDALRDIMLPKLVEARKTERTLAVWCAACSSGQEPYSLAILIKEHFPELIDWKLRIYATDLSEEVLLRAREGMYSQFEVNRGLPVRLLVKYFNRVGTNWQVHESLRSMIEFRKMNLTTMWPQLPRFDIVAIRNVLIYFDQQSRQTIIERIRRVIRSDGFLLLGGSETLLGLTVAFRREEVAQTVSYRPT